MILRRLAEHLKEQNWAAISIEFVLLVLGVFLGIQVANWNEARQEHQRGLEYIERLRRDFDAIDARLTEGVRMWRGIAESPRRLLLDFEAFQRTGAWPREKAEILVDLSNTLRGRVPASRAPAYVELVSVGQVGLIRDIPSREALHAYDAQTESTNTVYNLLLRRNEAPMAILVAHLAYNQDLPLDVAASNVLVMGIQSWSDVDLESMATDPKLTWALNSFALANWNQLFAAKLQQERTLAVKALLNPQARSDEGAKP